jgi:crossover junction endodeoxyribonuclease RusA
MATERKVMTLRLPFPRSVNTYWRNIGRGRTILSKAGRQYKLDVLAAVLDQCGKVKPINSRVSVSVWLYPPDKRRRDLDNHAGKALFDSLTSAGVWADDELIDRLRVYRGGIVPNGLAVVRIRELN